MKYFETKKDSLEEVISKAINEKPDSSKELKESKMGALFLDMQIDAQEMSEKDFIKKYNREMGMSTQELKRMHREFNESTEFSNTNAKELEEAGGKYLKYSDLLLQKGRMMAKGKNTAMIDREISKEMKKLGIKEATGDKEKYQKFFNKAMKKFGVDSPADLKGDKKKEFFNYVDKNYKGDHEEELDKEDKPTVQKVVKMLKKASKAHADQSKSLEKDLQDNVDKTLDRIRESNVEKSKSMRSILADIWKVNEGKNPFEKDEGFASDAQRRAAFASGYKEKGKKKKEEVEKSKKTMTDKKPTKVEIEPVVEAKTMVAIDKKNKMKYLFFYGQKIEYNGKPYETDSVVNQQVLKLKGRGRDSISLSKEQIQQAFQTGKFKVVDIGNNPQHAVKI